MLDVHALLLSVIEQDVTVLAHLATIKLRYDEGKAINECFALSFEELHLVVIAARVTCATSATAITSADVVPPYPSVLRSCRLDSIVPPDVNLAFRLGVWIYAHIVDIELEAKVLGY